MWPDRVSNPGPLTLESDSLPTVLRGPACCVVNTVYAIDADARLLNAQYQGGEPTSRPRANNG